MNDGPAIRLIHTVNWQGYMLGVLESQESSSSRTIAVARAGGNQVPTAELTGTTLLAEGRYKSSSSTPLGYQVIPLCGRSLRGHHPIVMVGQPEVRQYRTRFYDPVIPIGIWSANVPPTVQP